MPDQYRMTALARDALEQIRRQPLRRVHTPGPGKPPWPKHPSTLAALVKRGFVARTEGRNKDAHKADIWTITDEGRTALNPPPRLRVEPHHGMGAKGAATSLALVNGVWQHQRFPEPEKVLSPGAGWVQRGRNLHAEARNRKQRARYAKAA